MANLLASIRRDILSNIDLMLNMYGECMSCGGDLWRVVEIWEGEGGNEVWRRCLWFVTKVLRKDRRDFAYGPRLPVLERPKGTT